MQITFDIFFVFYDALYQTAVKLVKASVVEKARELLQPGKGFARCHNSAGISVQAVAHGRAEGVKGSFCHSSLL